MAIAMELDYRLRWMDFDRYGRIQPFAVLDIFQDLATVQAEDMGIGRDDMMAKGVFWAVVRSKFEIVKPPSHYQVVTARTWPHTMSSFSFMRDFSIRDEAGDLLIKASSEWVLMDIESRKFVKVTDHYTGSEDFDEEIEIGIAHRLGAGHLDHRLAARVLAHREGLEQHGALER